jgi:hypothetical protein
VIVNGVVIGGPTPGQSRRQLTYAQVVEENKALHRKIAAQERAIRSLLDKEDGLVVTGDKIPLSSRESSFGVDADVGSSGVEGQTSGERTEYLEKMGLVFGLSTSEMRAGEQVSPLLLD